MDPKTQLLQTLAPVLEKLAQLPIANAGDRASARAIEDALDDAFPFEGQRVRDIEAAVQAGVDAGWLCNRGEAPVRFGRLAKPSPETHGFSIDAVELGAMALAHGHPRGEITLGFIRPGSDPERTRFDGRTAGWVCMPAGSSHTPTVTGGTMALLYFLPGGEIAWNDNRQG